MADAVAFALGVLARNPGSLPRYTSYPPANHFAQSVGSSLLPALVEAARNAPSVSVYIHVPYCDRLCWFCGCHTKHTLKYEPVRDYVDGLLAEIALWQKALGTRPKLSHLHLGGGSPSLLQGADLIRIRAALEACFDFSEQPEISIEIDPTDVKRDSIANLAQFGLTRASIGVQDFDPAVQQAINRPQSFEDTARVVTVLRQAGIASVNIDALYGLPLQTEGRLRHTIDQVISLAPDRVALFGYAHVPWMKPHQKLINEADLADGPARFRHARMASEMLVANGYQAIGIDHFALPGDGLAVAARAGKLHRNFQGYTTDMATVLVPLGPSSIGKFKSGYVQNEVATGRYLSLVGAGRIPASRGLALMPDDIMRAWIIERLMCDFGFSFAALEQHFGATARPLQSLARSIATNDPDKLCHIRDGRFEVKPEAQSLVRLVAARFDAWLEAAPRRYSKAV